MNDKQLKALIARFVALFGDPEAIAGRGRRVEFRPMHGRQTPRFGASATILSYRDDSSSEQPYIEYWADGAPYPTFCPLDAFLDDDPTPIDGGSS